jgi:hypothetical protein
MIASSSPVPIPAAYRRRTAPTPKPRPVEVWVRCPVASAIVGKPPHIVARMGRTGKVRSKEVRGVTLYHRGDLQRIAADDER